MTASWELLDERSENELHKTRLLNVEEKPFKRITKRLALVSKAVATVMSTQPYDFNGDDEQIHDTESLQEELTLDFAAFDSSIARFQFIHDANQRERQRYQVSQQRILTECNAVRENNNQLREQLDGARQRLAKRKRFDELADKITSNRLLRPRQDQVVNLMKLEDECRELERESETYSATWRERREQFNRIMEEGKMLRRQIRDEKEEVDRREGMNDGDDDDADGDKESQTPRNTASERATPRPEMDHQPKATDSMNPTSRPVSSSGTPAPEATRDGSKVYPSRDVAQDVHMSSSGGIAGHGTHQGVDIEHGEQSTRVTNGVDDKEDGETLSNGDQLDHNQDSMEVDG